MRILVAEDERDLNRLICRTLERAGYSVDTCFDGEAALDCLLGAEYDCLLLDIMMPKKDGHEVLRAVRAQGSSTPVIFLTARDSVQDRIEGLDLGADDYLVKPFDFDELLARIEAILRRTTGRRDVGIVAFKELALHTRTRQAFIADEPLALKGKQYDILEYLVSHQGSLISKERLFDKIWGFMSDTSSNVVEVYVSALRKALAPTGYDRYIKTIRGAGYLFTEDDHD